ncbi:hypothetical protein DAPPUDRAFT_340563 [Daphnia pulex]|uniref:Uncharacterized protein n=1 Tax=Daphnia pulex TaxID=6669 RepID=E9I4D0_DAPPU|nr:hypothetical protein DAPPUDRAFT_340563 [Daphnia pulex]|eukprot:EFX61149.1 hypothetical protein DAPPUDRAFT_340563 [Daphnia pulex]
MFKPTWSRGVYEDPGCYETDTWIRRNYRISDSSTNVNNLLKLKPLSSFASKQHGFENENNQEKSQGIKTLFFWKEWVRFIEYRRNVIDRTHVPTAIRKAIGRIACITNIFKNRINPLIKKDISVAAATAKEKDESHVYEEIDIGLQNGT